jgi:hypothetical protein
MPFGNPYSYQSTPVSVNQTARDLVIAPFTKFLGAFKINGNTTLDATSFEAVTGHGIIAGELVAIGQEGNIYLATVLSVDGDTINCDTSINFVYTNGDATAWRNNFHLNQDGSLGTPVIYSLRAPGDHVWHINRMMFEMICDTAPDDSKFGDLATLTNGIVIRIRRNGNERFNIANIKRNGGFKLAAFDANYTDKAGAGKHGVAARLTFAGDEKMGSPIELNGNTSDELQIIIQDALSGLFDFRVLGEGNQIV